MNIYDIQVYNNETNMGIQIYEKDMDRGLNGQSDASTIIYVDLYEYITPKHYSNGR